jgi:hypothetical protein
VPSCPKIIQREAFRAHHGTRDAIRARVKLDRERFLFLVSAVAAGCASTVPALPPEAPPTDVPVRPTPSVAPSAAIPQSPGDAPNPYEDDAPPQAAPKVVGLTCSASLNARGFPRSCAGLRRPSSTCHASDGGDGFPFIKEDCDEMKERLKPRVAEKAIACVMAKSGRAELCVDGFAADCTNRALSEVCLETAAKAPCAKVMETCGAWSENKASQESCEAGYSGLREEKRPRFLACMTEFCDFVYCANYS